MADEDSQGESRTVRLRGGPNAQELSKSKKKYKSFDQRAQTEYDRLVKENDRHQLKPNTDAAQQATFIGCVSSKKVQCIYIYSFILQMY
jgi:hypothetical protein